MTIDYRIAATHELTQIADLRWRLHVDDEPIDDRGAYEGFIAEFLEVHEAEWKSNEVIHWVAADGDRLVAIMSVVFVRKIPFMAAGAISPIPTRCPKCEMGA
jgi:hypothetical protein